MDRNDDIDALATENELQDVAAQMRSEWLAEYEETAGEARMQWEHGRTMIERVRDLMARGDVVVIDVGDMSFRGTLTNLGTDWCTVTTDAGTVDVRLATHMGQLGTPAVIRQVERGRSGGMRAPQPPMGFRARCYELEMEGAPVRIGSALHADTHTGSLVVGADHLVVTNDQGETLISLDWVAWIASGPASH